MATGLPQSCAFALNHQISGPGLIPAIRRCIGIAQVHLLLLATQAQPPLCKSLNCVSIHAAADLMPLFAKGSAMLHQSRDYFNSLWPCRSSVLC